MCSEVPSLRNGLRGDIEISRSSLSGVLVVLSSLNLY